jgi:hypothetical protein
MMMNGIRRKAGLAVVGGAVGLAAALMVGVGTAYATTIKMYGATAWVEPQVAQVCSTTYLSAYLWYAEATGSGGEVGGTLVAPPNRCVTKRYYGSGGPTFRHFHLCNGFGECSREFPV